MAALFGILVTFLIVGWLWFYVVRPICEDWGFIPPVNHYTRAAPVDMSSADEWEEDEPDTYQAPEPQPNQYVPDTYQVNRSTPVRTSTKQSDAEWIATLAHAKGEDGKYRFTANAIAALVGGTRKEVLDQVRAIRNLPQFPELTPEQRKFREQLGLTQR